SLKATALAAVARASLEFVLRRRVGVDQARAVLGAMSMGVRPDAESDLPTALRDLINGRLDQMSFLEPFGHRGNQEMELAQPRWSEDPSALDRLLQRPLHAVNMDNEDAAHSWERIVARTKLSPLERTMLESQVRLLRTYLSLRETAKHHFMR